MEISGCVMRYKFTVRLNGTDKNPWNKYGLTQNPFPQIGKAEFNTGESAVRALDGEPIKGPNDIRERLKGFTPEFIQLCIDNFKPGERTAFEVIFIHGENSEN